MKIVLRQDVPKLGEAGTIQNVANGYARNYLIPQGMAVVATSGEIKVAEHNLKVRERKVNRQEEQLQSTADKIAGTRLEFVARAGDQGRLFGSVTTAEIASQLAEKTGQEVDRRKIQLTEPIRTIGEHEVEIHLIGRLRPVIVVAVEAEKTDDEEAEEATVEVDKGDAKEMSEETEEPEAAVADDNDPDNP